MNLRLLPDKEMSELRGLFAELGYTRPGLEASVGTASPPGRAGLAAFMHRTREDNALSALARAFLAGLTVPAEIAAVAWPERFRELCQESGLLAAERGGLAPGVTLIPRGELLFATDALAVLGTGEAGEFVPPASTHAAGYLLDLTLRRPVHSALDLGTGCGVQALAAAAHSMQVVASDISPRALRYAEFNACLNRIGNVEFVKGSLFAPVAGRRFDLIVSNPPFVPGPGGRFGYRDAEMELDSLCRQLVREAPEHLNEGGILQMLCEWVELENEPWEDRLASWTQGLGCDFWVLRSPPQSPASYAALRIAEISGPGLQSSAAGEYGEWLEYYAAHRVKAIHPGVIVMRRRRGRNWLHVQPLTREPAGPTGEAILENLAACDFLASCSWPDGLLDAVLTPAPELHISQVQQYRDGGWKTGPIRAWRGGPLELDARLDPGSAVVLSEFDGKATTRTCLNRLAVRLSADAAEFANRTLPVVRFFVERGLLLRKQGDS